MQPTAAANHLLLLLLSAVLHVATGGDGGGGDGLKVIVDDNGCPGLCVCKWRKGKETVSCRNTGYTKMPTMRHSGTQVGIEIYIKYKSSLPSLCTLLST
jgi:hypothetical protein